MEHHNSKEPLRVAALDWQAGFCHDSCDRDPLVVSQVHRRRIDGQSGFSCVPSIRTGIGFRIRTPRCLGRRDRHATARGAARPDDVRRQPALSPSQPPEVSDAGAKHGSARRPPFVAIARPSPRSSASTARVSTGRGACRRWCPSTRSARRRPSRRGGPARADLFPRRPRPLESEDRFEW